MTAPMMNKMQLCGAGAACGETTVKLRSTGPAHPAPRGARAPVAMALGAAALAVVASAWLVVSRVAPLPGVELTPGTCPVPMEAARAICPVPMQAAPAPTGPAFSLTRSTSS